MPLVRQVSFKAVLQRGNRVQVPKLVRWQFKMDASQVLEVSVKVAGSFVGREVFYARMNKDGRITIPRLTLDILGEGERKSLEGSVLEVQVEPAESSQKISG
jgi:bifunctional DNA-binding transcriptional regulator/antitoxin component of YhaV-PrlF toxin-antitoxin module